MRGLAIIAALLLAACGNCPFDIGPAEVCGWDGEDDIYGMHLVDRTSADNPISKDPNFRRRLRESIESGADFWGISPNAVSGWRLVLKDSGEPLGNCSGSSSGDLVGCNDWKNMTITVVVGQFRSKHKGIMSGDFCIEGGVLVHEMGHLPEAYSDGDHDHSRPRWYDSGRFDAIVRARFRDPERGFSLLNNTSTWFKCAFFIRY